MIVLVSGVSASGKSTVGEALAKRLGWVFEDGDALHPAANIAKMRAGIPLTDSDRWPWLEAIGAWVDTRITAGEPAVVACSALKRSYRDLLRRGRPQMHIVSLQVSRDVLAARLKSRHGHFFRASLLDSQLASFEPPGPAEHTLVVDGAAPVPGIVEEIVQRLGLTTGDPG